MKLNNSQTKILVLGLVLFAAMLIYPPWTYTHWSDTAKREKPGEYRFLLKPPAPEDKWPRYGVKIDASRLIAQVLALLALMGAGVLRNKDDK